jgi:membrane protease YdiL (CAAX protease family)
MRNVLVNQSDLVAQVISVVTHDASRFSFSSLQYSLLCFSPVGYLLWAGFAYNGDMTQRYWLFVALTLALTGFIGYNTYLSAQLLRRWRPDRNLLLLPAENLLRLGLVLACLGLGVLSGLDARQLGWLLSRWPAQLLWGVGWGVGLAGFLYLSTRWILQRSGQRFYSSIIVQAIVPKSTGELLGVSLVMISVVLLEELLFRSLLLGGLAPILPAPLLLIGWSVVFGLLHSPQGLWGMIGAGLAGAVLGWLFLQHGSLLTPLIAHYVTNMVQVLQAMRLREQLDRPAAG